MAATGLTVFAHSFGCFAARRMFDQAFLAAGYSELPVHVIGSDPGVCAAFNGATHMPFEDCALYMNIPNAVVIDSCDFAQTKALTRKLAACGSPSYMRLIRKGFTTVYADDSDFEIGKGVTLRDGKDVTIIASGILVDEALKAEEMLAAKGISARVIDMHTWSRLTRSGAPCGCRDRLHRHSGEPSGRHRSRLCHYQPDERKESGSGGAHRHPEPLRSGRSAGFPYAAV